MPVEWLEVLHENVLTRIAMIEGYSLTIVGEEGLWLWFVDLNGHNAVEGATHNLHAAMAAAENAARRLAGNGSSLPRA